MALCSLDIKAGPRRDEAMVFAFCISDSYAQHAAVVMASALESNPGEAFVFHILSSDLSEESREKLLSMVEPGRLEVRFHVIDRSVFDRFPVPLAYISQEAYYRYLIPELIDARRVIYSDVDVLVRGPLRELWEVPLSAEQPLAAVREGAEQPLAAVREGAELLPIDREVWRKYRETIGIAEGVPYFYSGLLVMDCEALRAEGATAKLMADTAWCAEHLPPEEFTAADQVVINRVFANRIRELSFSYCVTGHVKTHWKGKTIIRHYAGYYEKPWCYVAKNWSWGPYWLTLCKTPYRARAVAFFLRHLWSLIWSVHTKAGKKRWFLFGVQVCRREVG